ncbi:MAG: hypothetical protein ABFD92_03625 [Planctomycetaceae bacterium]|nr:hypothetical protein [Planctomycetaceae bacterium]
MSRRSTILIVPVVLVLVVLAVGCQQPQELTHGAGQTLTSGDAPSVLCDRCKTVWIKRPDTNIKGMITLRPEKVMECPDCKSAAENFFLTGKLQHSCKTCGGTMEQCHTH